jgi:hypothetical protein
VQLGVDGVFGRIVGLLAGTDDLAAALGDLRLLPFAGEGCLDRGVLAIRSGDLAEAAVIVVIAAAIGVDDAVVVLGVLVEILRAMRSPAEAASRAMARYFSSTW